MRGTPTHLQHPATKVSRLALAIVLIAGVVLGGAVPAFADSPTVPDQPDQPVATPGIHSLSVAFVAP
ncbi:MAG TPA: hypothetical protein VFR41_05515, partial [Acidimicrobiia bacterium]|nr:hypothetical protein [Acidimicrobiia bacterium]